METKIKDRGWVKNVAIVFLSVMLVLTFFSNTIMNRSLPEVATQSVGSSTITAQVRGTGKVSATQNYEVKIDQTRTVKSVMVKVGQEVSAGDVLFVLSDAPSDELESAQESLRSLSTSYQKALISASQSDYARENRDIQRARENLEEAEQKRDSLVAVTGAEVLVAEAALNAAKESVKQAQKKLDSAQEDLDDIGGKVEADDATLRGLRNVRDAKQDAWDAAKEALESAKLIYGSTYKVIEDKAKDLIRASKDFLDNYANKKESTQNAYIAKKLPVFMPYALSELTGAEDEPKQDQKPGPDTTEPEQKPDPDKTEPEQKPETESGSGTETGANTGDEPVPPASNEISVISTEASLAADANKYQTAYDKITACEQAVDDAHDEYISARDAYNRAMEADNSSEYNSASRAVKKAQETLTAAQEEQAEAEERLSDVKSRKTEYDNAYEASLESVKSRQMSLEDLIFSLQEQQKADNRNAQLEKLDLQELAAQVGKAQQRVNELRGDNGEKEIVAEVPGVIESIGITAGNKTTPDVALATIELPDMGYTMSFSVTNEQARLIHAGDSATVSNYYYGSQIIATVSSVKTDPKNPQTSKLVTFDVTGDVNVGADLTVSVGQRSQEYDFVVPNSALRSDSNGDFILVITAKNSPLGNRYIATRVDVSKIASDDTNTAVTGALNRGDFVITTSTKPIENGQQVRMQDT